MATTKDTQREFNTFSRNSNRKKGVRWGGGAGVGGSPYIDRKLFEKSEMKDFNWDTQKQKEKWCWEYGV